MDKTYNWLYREHTLPLLSDMAEEQGKLLRDLTYSLPLTTGDRLDVYDTLTLFRHNWGMEAFALGVQLGIQLTQPRPAIGDNKELLDVLS